MRISLVVRQRWDTDISHLPQSSVSCAYLLSVSLVPKNSAPAYSRHSANVGAQAILPGKHGALFPLPVKSTDEISFQGTLRSSLGQCQEHTLYEKQSCLQDVEGGRNNKRTDRLRQWKDRVRRLAIVDVMSTMCPASY